MSRKIGIPKLQDNRIFWLDALRGIVILMVVYGHCVRNTFLVYLVLSKPVRMPLIFMISAYLFNDRHGDQKDFLSALFTKLVVPWLILGLFPYTRLSSRFFDLVSGEAFWFMSCLIIARIIFFYVKKVTNNDTQLIILGLILSICGYYMYFVEPLRFANLSQAFFVQAFFVLGHLVRKYEKPLADNWHKWLIPAALLYLFMRYAYYNSWIDLEVEVHNNLYGILPITYVCIALGCMSLFFLFKLTGFQPRWLVYVGQNTLLIYMTHHFGFKIYDTILSYLGIHLPHYDPLWSLLKTAVVAVGCCCLAVVINKYAPFVVGKKYKRKN